MDRRRQKTAAIVLHVEQLDPLQIDRNVQTKSVRLPDVILEQGLEHRPQVGGVAAERSSHQEGVDESNRSRNLMEGTFGSIWHKWSRICLLIRWFPVHILQESELISSFFIENNN